MNLEFNYDKTVQRIIDRATDEVKERKSTRITDEFLLFSLYKDTQQIKDILKNMELVHWKEL